MTETITADRRPRGREGYANTDASLHFNTIDPQPDGQCYGVWVYLLKVRDYEAAAMVRRVHGGENGEGQQCGL